MATTTPNFGWPVPTSTDLVKDGAIAIEALGDGIDASLLDLKGGTTGQVLAKASGTDMDFSWVAQDDSNAIQNAIVDAKGDLIAASAADTPARLAVGSNGEILFADSSTSTGLRYQSTPVSNPAINGAFDIFQRGTSTTVNNAWTFVADRWMGYRATSCTYSRQATGDTTNLPNIQYCIRMARTAGDTATGTMYLQQSVETANAIPFAGQTVTFSFWARKGADYSSTSSLLSVFLYTGTGTDQNVKDGYTGSATPINTSVTLTTTWQRFQVTGTIAATATEFAPYFTRGTAGTAGAADHCEITGVMVSIGSIAPSFQRSGGTIQGELAACKYYFERRQGGTSFGSIPMLGQCSSTTAVYIPVFYTPKRSTPTLTQGGTWKQYTANATANAATYSLVARSVNDGYLVATTTGMVAGNASILEWDTSSYLDISSEL
jgi:hypothetical protein